METTLAYPARLSAEKFLKAVNWVYFLVNIKVLLRRRAGTELAVKTLTLSLVVIWCFSGLF